MGEIQGGLVPPIAVVILSFRNLLKGNAMSEAITVEANTAEGMKNFLEAFNTKDLNAIISTFCDDGVFRTTIGSDPGGRSVEGPEAIRAYFANMFEAIPDVRFSDDTHWLSADGTRGTSEWLITGTNPDGSKMVWRGCDLFTFREGKIALKDTYMKTVQG